MEKAILKVHVLI